MEHSCSPCLTGSTLYVIHLHLVHLFLPVSSSNTTNCFYSSRLCSTSLLDIHLIQALLKFWVLSRSLYLFFFAVLSVILTLFFFQATHQDIEPNVSQLRSHFRVRQKMKWSWPGTSLSTIVFFYAQFYHFSLQERLNHICHSETFWLEFHFVWQPLVSGMIFNIRAAEVWFSPVLATFLLNLELDFRFGSGNMSNFEPDHRFRVQTVRFRFRRGSN